MRDLGKLLAIAGVLLAVIGFVLWQGWGRGWLGRLPGDIIIERENFRLYIPIATTLLISLVLSLLFWLFRR